LSETGIIRVNSKNGFIEMFLEVKRNISDVNPTLKLSFSVLKARGGSVLEEDEMKTTDVKKLKYVKTRPDVMPISKSE